MKFLSILLVIIAISSSCNAEFSQMHEKVYIDEDELDFKNDAFHIHIGDNVWIQTNTVHKDHNGLFALENSFARSLNKSFKSEYEKKWKCPYCYQYWPIGKRCQNQFCPSKYKDY